MGHANGVITAPVNTDDVSAVINVPSHDVATLCLSSSINKWNKDKPYRGTLPSLYSRIVNNYANQTGVYLGCRGADQNAFPVYWGMQYPMNNAAQNNSGRASEYLIEMCYDICNNTGNHPNFNYVRPVVGTDFCRLEDFMGYNHKAGPFLEAGVAGQEPGTSYATLNINQFSSNSVTAYASIPSGSYRFILRDLIPEPNYYYLAIEFYIYNTTTVWKKNSTATPFLRRLSTYSLDNTPYPYLLISVKLADILQAGVAAGVWSNDETNKQFIACVGLVKINQSEQVQSGQSFVAPWDSLKQRCATLVSATFGSPYDISIQKYFFATTSSAKPTSDSSYSTFPTSKQNISVDGALYLKLSIYNSSNSSVTIGNLGTSGMTTGFRFRAYAVGGGYGNYSPNENAQNGSIGKERDSTQAGLNADTTSSSTSLTIPSKQSKTLYVRFNNLFPFGDTTTINIKISNDNGSTWRQSGSVTWAGFFRTGGTAK